MKLDELLDKSQLGQTGDEAREGMKSREFWMV
jgi:hypothetical protein